VKKPFVTLSSAVAWSSPWYNVRQDKILLPNGVEGTYNVVQKNDAVWIVPVTPNGDIVLIHTYRYTVDDWCWEVPAGNIEEGQTPQEAAAVELAQEAGGVAKSWEYIGRFYPANGICNAVGHIFLARGVTLSNTAHEPAEVMTVHRVSRAEALAMARDGRISDGPSALALLLCAGKLDA
jgi:ADP-ribose pyrophosphatase